MMAGCLLGLASIALAGQDVRIFVEGDDNGLSEARPAALRRALAQGVAQEAQSLLRNRLSERRWAILEEVLALRAQEYVLGWEENEYLPTEWGAVLHLDVRVNREALQDFLQSLGIYYTLDQDIDYLLEVEEVDAEQMAMLQDLEALSGLRRDDSDQLILRLAKAANDSWQAVLDHEGMVWSASGGSLPQVWAEVWGNYFQLDRVRQGFEDSVTVATWGWTALEGIRSFDRHLRGLEITMDRVDLLGIVILEDNYRATWRIATMDHDLMETSLRQYFQERPATFSLE